MVEIYLNAKSESSWIRDFYGPHIPRQNDVIHLYNKSKEKHESFLVRSANYEEITNYVRPGDPKFKIYLVVTRIA
ncbi:hypothetical protein P10VF_036 [Rhizobium phage vB_RleM_P10VF]|uniref:Uncharacterized protein n=1 Tax=Rhizobium phage vB_RleM_P10VF TaxID=1527770 RepID=A0A076YN93_9CAUD|nr:hypothetical protein P10VF_036 [Rhizobium phage vB_RleM_P10VF]AIK68249.1 hypothetical protein P10VF_036 [Rhizobium phage vB_RleM_P10VF]